MAGKNLFSPAKHTDTVPRPGRYLGQDRYAPSRQSSGGFRFMELLLWAVYTVAAIGLGFFWVYMFGLKVTASDASMEPLLKNGQSALVSTMVYRLYSPGTGDIVAFYPLGDTSAQISVKRIAAVPGETVQIDKGLVLIDGVPAPGSDNYPLISDPGMAATPIILKEGEYFVLGDNRNAAQVDSRSPGLSVIHADDIVGRVWLALPKDDEKMHLIRNGE